MIMRSLLPRPGAAEPHSGFAFAIPAEAVARGVAFAIEQPGDIEVSSIVIRPTAQD